jgi:C1A family cysteine protease
LLLAPACRANAATPVPPGKGVSLGTLQVGATTYHHVTLLSVNARTIMIMHSGGMASIRLRDLPPELQSRFGYSPAAESAADKTLQRANEVTARPRQQEPSAPERSADSGSKFEDLLLRFGQNPELRNETDLRPRFRQLDLGVKDQGRRPSCAVFAVVSALEYQNAELTGQAEQFSEEYLLWAARRILHRGIPSEADSASGKPDSLDDADEGFSLADVLLALRTYGIPPQSAMPNAGYSKMTDIPEPSPELVNQARTHRRVFVHQMPGHDTAAQIANVILALNSGMPVVIGLRWPNYRTIRAGFLGEQTPLSSSAHAVTLVGYQDSDEQIESTTFVFKNSYGPAWGEAGYGHVTYRYLQNNLLDAALIEVLPP